MSAFTYKDFYVTDELAPEPQLLTFSKRLAA